MMHLWYIMLKCYKQLIVNDLGDDSEQFSWSCRPELGKEIDGRRWTAGDMTLIRTQDLHNTKHYPAAVYYNVISG